MQNSICATPLVDVNVDVQTTNDMIMCLYAELCISCHKTALLVCKHYDADAEISFVDLIAAARYHTIDRNGFGQRALPLMRYICEHNSVPRGDCAGIDAPLLASVCGHLDAVRKLRWSRATGSLLGDALFGCLVHGQLCSTGSSNATTRTRLPDSMWNFSPKECSGGDSTRFACELCAAVLDTQRIEIPDATWQLYMCNRDAHNGACELCAAVTAAQRAWSAYCPSEPVSLYLKDYCTQLEQRLVQVAIKNFKI